MSTPSRRRFLTAGAGLLAAGAAVADAAPMPSGAAFAARQPADFGDVHAPDPALVVYAKLRAAEANQNEASLACRNLRDKLVERWGDYRDSASVALWERDPDLAALRAKVEESNGFTALLADLTVELVATPATTLAGLHAKAILAVEMFPKTDAGYDREWPGDGPDYHEEVALAVLKDTERLLAGMVGGG
jgi:hypothetical protein